MLDGLEKKTYGLSYLIHTLAKHLKHISLQDILFIFVVGSLSRKTMERLISDNYLYNHQTNSYEFAFRKCVFTEEIVMEKTFGVSLNYLVYP